MLSFMCVIIYYYFKRMDTIFFMIFFFHYTSEFLENKPNLLLGTYMCVSGSKKR